MNIIELRPRLLVALSQYDKIIILCDQSPCRKSPPSVKHPSQALSAAVNLMITSEMKLNDFTARVSYVIKKLRLLGKNRNRHIRILFLYDIIQCRLVEPLPFFLIDMPFQRMATHIVEIIDVKLINSDFRIQREIWISFFIVGQCHHDFMSMLYKPVGFSGYDPLYSTGIIQ